MESTRSPIAHEPRDTAADPGPNGADAVIEADSLVEEISIDGMCGVY
jgi:mycofactocin precursor